MFHKQVINQAALNGKRVLLRADYNVPIDSDGVVSSAYRIEQSIPTIRALQSWGCRVVICSHLGRPTGPDDKSCSLRPVARELSRLLDQHVTFVSDCVGDTVTRAIETAPAGEVVLLENVRFYDGEEKNDSQFALALVDATGAEAFVQDGFGVVHRAHATTDAITKLLPSYAGLLLEREVETITRVMSEPVRPLMAIIGGAKIADKIDIINQFIESADVVVIGGAMANTFLKAQDVEIGESLYDEDEIDTAHEILKQVRRESAKRRFVFYLPQDGVVVDAVQSNAQTRIVDWDTHAIADIEAYPKRPRYAATHVKKHEKIVDIGPFSGAFIAGAIQLSGTVIWNGTMGVTEIDGLDGPIGPFAHGTEIVIEALVGNYGARPFSLIGGGDTAGYIEERSMTDMFNHVSTGGGASLELMSGKTLPGVEALSDKTTGGPHAK